jgi:hypothetical protein
MEPITYSSFQKAVQDKRDHDNREKQKQYEKWILETVKEIRCNLIKYSAKNPDISRCVREYILTDGQLITFKDRYIVQVPKRIVGHVISRLKLLFPEFSVGSLITGEKWEVIIDWSSCNKTPSCKAL